MKANKKKQEITLEDLSQQIGDLTQVTKVNSSEIKSLAESISFGFDLTEKRFQEIDSRFDGIDLRLDGVDSRLDGIDLRLDGIDSRLDRVDSRFDGVDSRFDKLEKEMTFVKNTLEKHTTILKRLDEERIFTLNYVKRLESEIEKIKVHLKIA